MLLFFFFLTVLSYVVSLSKFLFLGVRTKCSDLTIPELGTHFFLFMGAKIDILIMIKKKLKKKLDQLFILQTF